MKSIRWDTVLPIAPASLALQAVHRVGDHQFVLPMVQWPRLQYLGQVRYYELQWLGLTFRCYSLDLEASNLIDSC